MSGAAVHAAAHHQTPTATVTAQIRDPERSTAIGASPTRVIETADDVGEAGECSFKCDHEKSPAPGAAEGPLDGGGGRRRGAIGGTRASGAVVSLMSRPAPCDIG